MKPAAAVVLKLSVDRDPLTVAALSLSSPEMLCSPHLISQPSGSSSPLSSSTSPSSAVVVAVVRLPAFKGMNPAAAVVLKLAIVIARLPAFEGMNLAAVVVLKLVVDRDPLAIAPLSLWSRDAPLTPSSMLLHTSAFPLYPHLLSSTLLLDSDTLLPLVKACSLAPAKEGGRGGWSPVVEEDMRR